MTTKRGRIGAATEYTEFKLSNGDRVIVQRGACSYWFIFRVFRAQNEAIQTLTSFPPDQHDQAVELGRLIALGLEAPCAQN